MTEVQSESGPSSDSGSAVNWLWLSLVTIVLDQVTKHLVYTKILFAERIPVLPFFDLTHRHNTGAAFSFLADQSGWQRWLFIGLGVGVSCVILVWLRRLPRRGQGLLAVALALILGGALGNVMDRVHYGFVVDFALVYYGDWQFPAFNVADSALTIGCVFLILDAVRGDRQAG